MRERREPADEVQNEAAESRVATATYTRAPTGGRLRRATRSSWALGLLACLAPPPSSGLASTLTWLAGPAPVAASFWDPAAWDPAATPAAGDDLELRDVSGGFPQTRFLGAWDLGGGASRPAQSASVGAVRVYGGDFTIDWGGMGSFEGDSGGLSAASLEMGDIPPHLQPAKLTLIGPRLVVSGDVRVGNTLGGTSTLRLQNGGLGASSLSADRILLFGNAARLVVDATADDVAVAANQLHAGFSAGVGMTLRGSPFANPAATLTFGEVILERVPGTPLDAAGRVDVNTHDFVAIAEGGPQGDMRLALGSASSLHVDPGYGPPVASASLTRLEAMEGATLTLDVDGGSAGFGGFDINQSAFGGLGYGGNLAVRVTNGGHLTLRAQPFSALGIPSMGPVQFLAADSPTSGAGSVDLLFDGSFANGSLRVGATGSSRASLEFRNGGGCGLCDVLVATENVRGSFRLGGGALFDFSWLRVVNSDAVFDTGATLGNQSRLTAGNDGVIALNDTASVDLRSVDVSGSNARIRLNGTGVRTLHAVNVGSDFDLATSGAKSGGNLPVSGARFELAGEARLRIGGGAAPGVAPLLAIGSGGSVTLDAASSAFIGDPLLAATYQAGAIVLDDGGFLHGNGVINGAGFASGTHPVVLNTGGNLNPGFSPGTLTIDGEYLQQSGTLTLEIGGVDAGEYDVLDAAQGASFLGGTLRFERLGDFVGVLGAQLDFFAGRAVSFDPSLVIEDNTGFGLAFDLATGRATITSLVTPEPPIAALVAAGCAGLAWIGRRRRDASSRGVATRRATCARDAGIAGVDRLGG